MVESLGLDKPSPLINGSAQHAAVGHGVISTFLSESIIAQARYKVL